MRSLHTFLTRLVDPALRRRRDRRLDDEVRLHLEMLAEELEAGGMPRPLAREEARRRFGGVDQMKMRYGDQRGLPVVEAVLQDVTLMALAATVLAVALLACAVPIRRALRIEPSVALRTE